MLRIIVLAIVFLNIAADIDCSATTLVLQGIPTPIIENGTVKVPVLYNAEHRDLFMFDLTYGKTPLRYSLSVDGTPEGGIEVTANEQKSISPSFTQFKIQMRCFPHVSYMFTMKAQLISYSGCPALSFNWTKICGTGEALPRKGLAITTEEHSKHFIVKDGVIIDANYMHVDGVVRTPVAKHHDHLTLFFHLLPIHKENPAMDINPSMASEIRAHPNFWKDYHNEPVFIHPPYASYDDSLVYPVVKDEAALGGNLNTLHSKKITIEFNCLGVEQKSTVVLHIDIPLHKSIKLFIDKECSKETLIDRIEESIVNEEEKYGLLKVVSIFLMLFIIIFSIITCYGVSQGKTVGESVPCCKSFFSQSQGSNNHPASIQISASNPSSLRTFPQLDENLEGEDDLNYTSTKYGSVE